jgi:hypothetical protein
LPAIKQDALSFFQTDDAINIVFAHEVANLMIAKAAFWALKARDRHEPYLARFERIPLDDGARVGEVK